MKNITIEYASGMKITLPATKTTIDRTLRFIRKKAQKEEQTITTFFVKKEEERQPLHFNTPEAKKSSETSTINSTNEKP